MGASNHDELSVLIVFANQSVPNSRGNLSKDVLASLYSTTINTFNTTSRFVPHDRLNKLEIFSLPMHEMMLPKIPNAEIHAGVVECAPASMIP